MADRTHERNRMILAARDASQGGTRDFTLAEVGARVGASRHVLRRRLGRKSELTAAMGRQNGTAIITYIREIVSLDRPVPELLHECLKWLLDVQLEIESHPATTEQVVELRREVTSLIEGLLTKGVRDGSVIGTPAETATLALDLVERLHSWGTAAISPEMALRGMKPGEARDDRSMLPIWELFFYRWMSIRELLGIHGKYEGEMGIAARLVDAGTKYLTEA